MKVIETFLRSKQGGDDGGEDRLFTGASFVAVIDGATAKSGQAMKDQPSPGARAAEAAMTAIASFEAGIAPDDAFRRIESAISAAATRTDGETPKAVCAIYSRARREIWRVGDISVRIGQQAHPGEKLVDRIAAAYRAALLRTYLLEGHDALALRASDPGREAILPLLRRQDMFENGPAEDPLSYAVLDGSGRCIGRVEVFPVPPRADIVLCSDGYLGPAATLAEAEQRLEDDLMRDPLRIGEFATTKAVGPDAVSFDDRAYIRVRTD
jgi:hypothetical protein